MSNEASVLKAVFEYLVYRHALVIRVNSGATQQPGDANGDSRFVVFYRWQVLGDDEHIAGVSDVLALLNGKLIAVECKAPGKKANVSAAQRRFLDEVESRGGLAIVAESIDDLTEALQLIGATQ